MQPKGLIVAVPLALAAALSLFIVSSDTASSLRIVVGVTLLLIAFVSTRLSLYLLVFSMLLSPQFLVGGLTGGGGDRKSTRLNSSHGYISYAVFCLKKKKLL